ncbi:right-handed parallel beta-helix repeat-containing protein, partial [Candidatus Woesearchaeota archaeon]|nr:right-handed parallel beta-helix repeat-containing protein [Candidatus Woesearchaeota archaeon]
MTRQQQLQAACFKVLANNVTIDCHGFEVNYSQSVVGYGVNISRYNYTTIRSCYVTQGSGSTFSYGVYVLNSSNSIFYNNSVQVRGSSGYGMYLVSSTHSSMIYNNNITIRGANAYSIYLFDNAYNNSIYSNIITNTGLNGILLNSYAYNNSIYSNIITLGSLVGGSGLYLLANVYNNSIYGNTVTTSASAAYALRLTSTVYSNQIYNNNLTTSNSDSYGVYLNNDIFNNTIYGNNITTNNAVGSYSIYMLRDINNNTFYRNAISSLAAGVVVNGSTLIGGEETRFNTFTNDTIVPCTAGCAGNYQDIILTANATDITFTNVSFNKSRIAFVAYDPSVPIEKNNLTIRWFLNVNVTNSTNNAAMIGAEVVINNSLGTNVFTGSTNSDGSIATVTVTEFTMNGSAPFNVDTDTCVGISNVNITCFTPMNITVNITGYDSNFTSVDVNRSKLVNVSLGITAILDTTAPIVNATLNKSLQLIEFNDIINLTANTTDETGLSFGQIIVNDTGFVRYFNFSLGGATTAQFSQNISVSCSNCIINFTARANDTSNNFRTNDTIVSVTPEKEITNCTNLDTANTNYSLTQDANSGGTCFYVLANNVGLDCHGFEINYSQSVVGYGVNISGYNYSTIRSCNIVQADLAADNSNAYGVYIFNNVINNNVFNNTITTIGSQGYDVYLFSGAYNNSVYGNNLVYISGSFGIGVYLNSNVYNNSVYGNNINTSGSSAYAVYLNSNVYNNSVYGNNITSIEIGVYLFSSTFNNEIYGNTITTTGNSNAYGVNLQSTAYSNNIHDNVITTNGNSGSGIRLFNTAIYANSIYNNNITTRGGTAYGIVLNANVFSNNIYGNNITTRGGTSSGISMATTIYNNSFYGNVITTTGSTGYGMDLSGYNNSVYGNVITTKGSSGYGMLLSGYNNSVYSNNITTYNTSSYGIYLNSNVFNNTIYDNNITTKNMTGSYGIYLLNRVNNNTFYRNSISSLAIGILVNGSGQTAAQTTRFNTFTNDTIVPCTSGCASNYQDIVLTANATDITFTNVSFNKSRVEFVPRSLSVPVEKNNMTVRWFLAVNVTKNDNTALQGAEVVINDSFNVNVFTGNTDATGSISPQTVAEYIQNGSVPFAAGDTCVGINNINITCFTPYNITINLTGYERNFTSAEVNRSRLVNVSLGLDTTAPVVNTSLNKSLTGILQSDIINLSANATDRIGLSVGQVIVNDTGFVRYFNFSLSGTSAQFSQNITISCAAGCVINFTARVNDTNGNVRTNDTIITVATTPDTTFPVVNTSINNTNPLVNDVINFTGNITDDVGLLSANWTYNVSGVLTKLNYSFAGGTAIAT